jgi:hypothetical protein
MHIQPTTHVLIAGSRDASREMLDYARRAVQRAHQLGWTVLVGDSPYGLERVVVNECRARRTRLLVAGTGPFPRNYDYIAWSSHAAYTQVTRDLYRVSGGDLVGGYAARDRWMVDQAQICLFIWNGDSPGTEVGYKYAVQRGKDAHLVNFDRTPQP